MKRLTTFLAGLFLAFSALATDLTIPQMQTLKALAEADQTAATYLAAGNDNDLASWYNTPTATIVWRTDVSVDSIMRNGMDWSRVDNLTVGKARIWDWMTRLGTFDASKANIRAGIDAAWVGTAADLAVRATVYTHCKRAATRAEAALDTGTGTALSPATLGWEGFISVNDASNIRVQ